MDVCITGWSALECWRKLREGGKAYLELFMQQNHRVLKATGAPSLSSSKAEEIAKRFELTLPLHIAVLPTPRRRNSKSYQTHVSLATDSNKDVFHLDEGFVLAHPSDLFMQLAKEDVSVPKLAQLGYELSSRHALRKADRKIIESIPIIDSIKLLEDCELRNTQAKRKALSSLRHVLPNSESPAETEMALKLLLPCSWGGFGLSGAELNPVIKLGAHSRALYEHKYCRADMFFKSKSLDIEYDGAEWHTSPDQRINDMKRWQALRSEGITVINVNASQLRNTTCMEKLARKIYSIKGERFRIRAEDFHVKQAKLYAYLASSNELLCPKS